MILSRISRLSTPAIVPLEIWDLPLEGALAWQRLGAPAVAALEASGASGSEIDARLARELIRLTTALWEGRFPRAGAARGFGRLSVCGGLADRRGLASALGALQAPFPVEILGGMFFPLEGGRPAARAGGLDSAQAAVVDVGQIGIKARALAGEHPPARILRPPGLSPWDCSADPPPSPRLGADLAERSCAFLASALHDLRRQLGATQLVLALPCELSADLRPGDCTYGPWSRRPQLILELARAWLDAPGDPSDPEHSTTRSARAGRLPRSSRQTTREREDGQIVIMTDTELAAWASVASQPSYPAGSTLVVTLGRGPGAALLRGEP